MIPSLIVLVDALEYSKARRLSALRDWSVLEPMRPGVGFSVNLDAELFAGLVPDQAGYFNEWNYDPAGSPFPRLGPLGRFLDLCGRAYPVDRLLHRVLSKVARRPLGNIPFSQLHLFRPFKLPVWDPEFPAPTLFSRFSQLRVVASHLVPGAERELGGRDAAGVDLARCHISRGDSVFLYLVDLDHVGHLHGPSSPEHQRLLNRLDEWLATLCDEFLARHAGGNLFVLSDHGMASVNRDVMLSLEERFGPTGPSRYVYFVDYTMCRIWTGRTDLLRELAAFFRSLEFGRLLGEDERSREGVADRRWGDLIFLLHEHTIFGRTHYGRGVPAGMHGFHPDAESQTAVFAYRGGRPSLVRSAVPPDRLLTRQVYGILRTALERS